MSEVPLKHDTRKARCSEPGRRRTVVAPKGRRNVATGGAKSGVLTGLSRTRGRRAAHRPSSGPRDPRVPLRFTRGYTPPPIRGEDRKSSSTAIPRRNAFRRVHFRSRSLRPIHGCPRTRYRSSRNRIRHEAQGFLPDRAEIALNARPCLRRTDWEIGRAHV